MIYLVEDDGNIREFVLYALTGQGFDAQGFEKPSQFFAALEKEVPELVLLDLMLPEEDGLSVLKRFRAAPATRHVPVIILSARDTEFDKVLGWSSSPASGRCSAAPSRRCRRGNIARARCWCVPPSGKPW